MYRSEYFAGVFFERQTMTEFEFLSCEKYGHTGANLIAAFYKEFDASTRYRLYAQKAQQEGYISIASFFNACSNSTRIHAMRHAKVARFIGKPIVSTEEINRSCDIPEMLHAILTIETTANLIYPDLILDAEDEGNRLAVLSFQRALDVQKKLIFLCNDAIHSSDYWLSQTRQFHVCALCGYLKEDFIENCFSCGIANYFLSF